MAVLMRTRVRRATVVLLWCVAALIATLRAAMQFAGSIPRHAIPSKSSRVAAKSRGGDGDRTQAVNKFEFMGVRVTLPDLPTPEVEIDPEVEASVKQTGTNVGTGLAAGGAAAVFSAIAIANPVVGAVGVGAAAVAAVVTNLPEAAEESSPRGKSGSKSKSEDGSFIDEKSLWDYAKGGGGFLIGCVIAFVLAALYGFSVKIPFLAGGLFGAVAAGGAAWLAIGTPLPEGVSYDEKEGLKLPEVKSGMEIGGFKLPTLPFQDDPEEKKEKVQEEEGFNPFSWLPGSDSKDSKDK